MLSPLFQNQRSLLNKKKSLLRQMRGSADANAVFDQLFDFHNPLLPFQSRLLQSCGLKTPCSELENQKVPKSTGITCCPEWERQIAASAPFTCAGRLAWVFLSPSLLAESFITRKNLGQSFIGERKGGCAWITLNGSITGLRMQGDAIICLRRL